MKTCIKNVLSYHSFKNRDSVTTLKISIQILVESAPVKTEKMQRVSSRKMKSVKRFRFMTTCIYLTLIIWGKAWILFSLCSVLSPDIITKDYPLQFAWIYTNKAWWWFLSSFRRIGQLSSHQVNLMNVAIK